MPEKTKCLVSPHSNRPHTRTSYLSHTPRSSPSPCKLHFQRTFPSLPRFRFRFRLAIQIHLGNHQPPSPFPCSTHVPFPISSSLDIDSASPRAKYQSAFPAFWEIHAPDTTYRACDVLGQCRCEFSSGKSRIDRHDLAARIVGE